MIMKICNKCKTTKYEDEFHRNKSKPDGLQTQCKSCTKNAYDKHPDKFKKRMKTNKQTDKSKYLKRIYEIGKKYDLSEEEYRILMDTHKGCCGICGKSLEKPCVDHNHSTGFIRGLLCQPCNSAIGLLGDTLEDVLKAVTYLQRVI